MDYPEQLEVSSSQAAASAQSQCMGVYKMIDEQWIDQPVWRSTGVDRYIYRDHRDDLWVIGWEVGDVYSGIRSSSTTQPSPHLVDEWEYFDVDDEWKVDSTLTVCPYVDEGNCMFVLVKINPYH